MGWVKVQFMGEWKIKEVCWSWCLKEKARWQVCYWKLFLFVVAKQTFCFQRRQMLQLSNFYWILYQCSWQQLVRMELALARWLAAMLVRQVYQLFRFYCLDLNWWLPFQQPSDAELPSVYYKNIKLPSPTFLSNSSSACDSMLFLLQSIRNNFIMAQRFDSEKRITQIEKKMVGGALLKSEQQKKRQIFEYDNQEFMVSLQEPANSSPPKGQAPAPQIKKSMVLSKMEVERSLTDIYNYYIRVYEQPSKEFSQFDAIGPRKLDIKGFLLFAKNFGILKTIFSLDRMILIFKKHADYGKYLSFDNFYFTINSMSHEQEVKTFFHLDSMLMNLDIETIEELEKQEFYNYLQLKDPEVYRKKYTQLFGPFNISQKPHSSPLKYNYRKFSLPELRKKALLQPRQKKKGEKDLFILKNDRQMHQNVFDEAKSIVVSWDSLRAKSVNNLGKPAELVQKKYLKIDPQEDPYLQEVRPPSRPSPKSAHKNERQGYQKQHYGNKIEKKIKEIQQSQSIKNQQILNRIEKKLKLPSSRKLQM